MAKTFTAVQTYARFALLELQVRTMLRESAGLSDKTLERISRGLRDPHYIEVILVRGLHDHGTIGAELMLSIDWRTHSLELSSGGAEVQVPDTWSDGIAPSITEGVRTFLLACEEARLTREFSVVYGRQFNRDEVNRILGFTRGTPRKWENSPVSLQLGLGQLREASLVVRIAP